jgi:hypothetical protein
MAEAQGKVCEIYSILINPFTVVRCYMVASSTKGYWNRRGLEITTDSKFSLQSLQLKIEYSVFSKYDVDNGVSKEARASVD